MQFVASAAGPRTENLCGQAQHPGSRANMLRLLCCMLVVQGRPRATSTFHDNMTGNLGENYGVASPPAFCGCVPLILNTLFTVTSVLTLSEALQELVVGLVQIQSRV